MELGFSHFLLLIIANISFIASSQVLDTNTIWSEANRKLYHIKGDTVIINSKKYNYIHSYSDTNFHYSASQEAFLLREEGEKIFWRNSIENKDYLLYDFGLSVGDSLFVTPISIYTQDSVLIICESVDTINVMGVNRRRLSIRTANPSAYYNTDIEYWLWGIGSTLGLLNSGHLSFAFVDQIDPDLFCCHKEFDQVFQGANNILCHISYSSLEKLPLNALQIFQNPSANMITISSQQEIVNVLIYDLTGRLVDESNSNNPTIIYLSSLKSGFYSLRIQLINGITFRTFYHY